MTSPTHTNHPPYLGNAMVRLGALAIEPLYAAAMAVRNIAYDRGWRATLRAHAPVISIGNLTTGGTGKTPSVVYIVHHLQSYGARPAVILRGYKPDASGRSDEQELLRNLLPGVPIVADPDRAAAARLIQREHPQINVIVLDDAFQHRRLHRDLDLVLIDATNPFGFRHVLPRGLMREHPSALRRAGAVIVTRANLVDSDELAELDRRIAELHGKPPIAHTAHTWSQVLDEHDRPVTDAKARVFIMAGIGNPRAFMNQAAQRFTILDGKLLPDHAHYTLQTLDALEREMEGSGAQAVLTTEKDWVKLRPLIQSRPLPVPVWRPRLCIACLDGEKELDRILLAAISQQDLKFQASP